MGLFYKQGAWWIDYYYQGKRKRKKIGTSRKLAETVLQKIKVQIAERKYLDVEETSKVLFREFALEYEKNYAEIHRRTWHKERYKLENLIKAFGDVGVSGLTPQQIEGYKAQRLASVKPASVNRELALLRHLLNKAVEWEKVKESPFRGVKLFKGGRTKVKVSLL